MPAPIEHSPSAEHRAIAQRYREARNITLIGALINLVLAVVKIMTGLLGHSWALVADGVHSFSDLVTDGLVLFGASQGSRGPDAKHPYGHGKIETLMTLFLGLILVGTAIAILLTGVNRVRDLGESVVPTQLVIWVAALGVLSKEVLYHYTLKIAKKQSSNLLKANAWHHRTDSVSSIVVLAGAGGAMIGFPYLDPLAAIVVAVMIGRIGWELLLYANRDLTDSALDEKTQQTIRQVILGVSGVVDLHMLRTRYLGPYALVDVHAIVEPKISVSEGHRIAEKIRDRVIWRLDQVTDVLVHIDPENDEGAVKGRHLPLRSQMERVVREAVKGRAGADQIGEITLHYFKDEVRVDLHVPVEAVQSVQKALDMTKEMVAVVSQLPHVAGAEVHFVATTGAGQNVG